MKLYIIAWKRKSFLKKIINKKIEGQKSNIVLMWRWFDCENRWWSVFRIQLPKWDWFGQKGLNIPQILIQSIFSTKWQNIEKKKNGLLVGHTFCQRFFFHKRTLKGKKPRKRTFAQVSPKGRKKREQWPIRLHKLPKLAPPCQCHQDKKKKEIKSYICMQVSFGMSSLKWESFL